MDVRNSVTYVGFNTGVISTAAVIILISLLILYLLISKDSNYLFCEKRIFDSMWNIIIASVFCGVFFFFGHIFNFTEYMLSDYTLSDISIVVFGAALFLLYLAISFLFTAIVKALCKFLYKILRKMHS